MSKKNNAGAGRKSSGLRLSEWSLRRKVALALAVPMGLAAVFGGLRVQTELEQAANYRDTASQVTVLRPAVAYLAAAEHAAVVARERTAAEDPARDTAVAAVAAAGAELESARDTADLTPAQREQLNEVLDLSAQLRTDMGYLSIGQSVSQVRQLHRGVTALINTIVAEQIEPEPRLQILSQTLDGRISLAMQQLAVAYGTGDLARPRQLAAEIGIESSAIERLGVALGATDPTVLALRQQNALHFGTIRENGTDLGDETAFAGYDTLSEDLLNGIDTELTSAATESRNLALVNSAVTVGTLLAAILLALLISRMLLNPIRRVREGALHVAREELPEEVARIRAGEDPGEITPIAVTSREEIGQLARAVDDLHRQALHLASGEAKLRSQVGDMFVTLSRRNTTLVNQQLGLIEALERDEEDPERLESLFKLDHLASRMRRTAESLMVLADAPTQTGGQEGISVADTLHAATAGVQDYQRVQILSSPTERIIGSAAADVVHLITELVDNALNYSPPTAPVLVMTTTQPGRTVISISDAGLGIDTDSLAQINSDLTSGGEMTPDTARRMGLHVVSRLARRHGISVSLERNDRGGSTATVTLPRSILSYAATPAPTPEPEPVADSPVSLVPALESSARTPSPAAAPADAEAPAEELDPIEAAINAVIGLPQRQPGSSIGATPTGMGGEGGSLLQRLNARDARDEEKSEEPAARDERPALELVRHEPIALGAPAAEPEPEPEAEPEAELETVEQPAATENGHAYAAFRKPDPADEPVESVETVESVESVGSVDAAPAEDVREQVPAQASATNVLDAATPAPSSDEEVSPIFGSLRSNWLSADGGTAAPWASTEVEAGWEAADRVAEAPALQLSESGLPVRRPGGRLVPGGVVTPAPTVTVRDPEAIRARLAAHAAGVSRGRSATTPVPADREPQEAGQA